MYELIQVAENTFYIDCPAKMGIYRLREDCVWMIDSGSDKDAAKKALKALDARGWRLEAVLCTHSHADHIGGCQLLQQRTGCAVYAQGLEAAFTRFPVLEPMFLYGGYPCRELRGKFLMAQPSTVQELTEAKLPQGMEILPLPGHSFDMFGVKTPDGVYFLADCLTGENVLEKYHISYIYDVAAYLQTLDAVEKLQGAVCIPAHAGATEDIAPLVRRNRDKVEQLVELTLTLCRASLSWEELLQRVMDHFHLSLDLNQYVLAGSTLRSYLAYLHDGGRIGVSFEGNMLRWRTVEAEDAH